MARWCGINEQVGSTLSMAQTRGKAQVPFLTWKPLEKELTFSPSVHWMAVKGSSTLMLEHVNGSSNLHWFNLTRSLHDLLTLPQISSCQTAYLWLPGSHSLACPAPPRPSSVIICTTLAQIPHDSSVPWHTLIAPPALLAVNPQLISFFPTGTISLSVSQLPPSPSTPLISLQPPAKWIMRSISPPRPPGLFHSLRAQPASPPLPAATRLQTPPPPQHPMWRPIRFNAVAHAVHTPKKVFGFQVTSLLRSP